MIFSEPWWCEFHIGVPSMVELSSCLFLALWRIIIFALTTTHCNKNLFFQSWKHQKIYEYKHKKLECSLETWPFIYTTSITSSLEIMVSKPQFFEPIYNTYLYSRHIIQLKSRYQLVTLINSHGILVPVNIFFLHATIP